MRGRVFATLSVVAVGVAFALLNGSTVGGQASTGSTRSSATAGDIWAGWNPPRTGYAPRRTPDGQPDIQGVYMWPPGTRPVVDEESGPAQGATGPARAPTGDGSAPTGNAPEFWYEGRYKPDGTLVQLSRPRYPSRAEEIVYQPWAAAKRAYIRQYENKQRRLLDPRVRCFTMGLPRINNPQPYFSNQFRQAAGKVTIFYEANHDYRMVPLDGRPHIGPTFRFWMGDSRGHWEGTTLVVDVTNFNDKTWLAAPPGSGTFHSDALHVVERYTPLDPDQIYYEAWVDDPNVLAKPFRMGLTMTRAWQAGYEQLEYACHEGNKAVDNILDGAANLALPPAQRK